MVTLEKVNADYQTQLNEWIKHEKAAIDLISAVGKLWFEKSILLFPKLWQLYGLFFVVVFVKRKVVLGLVPLAFDENEMHCLR